MASWSPDEISVTWNISTAGAEGPEASFVGIDGAGIEGTHSSFGRISDGPKDGEFIGSSGTFYAERN